MNMKDLVKKNVSELTADEKAFIKANKKMLDKEGEAKFKECFDETAQPTAEELAAKQQAEADAKVEADKKAAADAAQAEADKKVADEKAAADKKATEDANIAAGKNADGTEKVQGSEKVQISASELAMLRDAADKGKQAFAELKKAKIAGDVSKLIFNDKTKEGAFLPKSQAGVQAFMETLSDTQYAAFVQLVGELPKSASIFKEIGKTDTSGNAGDAQATIETKVAEKMKAFPKMKYSEALKEVNSENLELAKQYIVEKGGKIISA